MTPEPSPSCTVSVMQHMNARCSQHNNNINAFDGPLSRASRVRWCKKHPLTPYLCGKGKGFPYWLPSFGPRADPSVQAVSPQVTDYKSSTRR